MTPAVVVFERWVALTSALVDGVITPEEYDQRLAELRLLTPPVDGSHPGAGK